MITRRSRAEVSTVSIWIAVLPPTRIAPPYSGMACTASRTARTVFSASSPSATALSVAWICTWPLTTSGGAPAACGPVPAAVTTAGSPEIPSTPATVLTTCSAAASGAMIDHRVARAAGEVVGQRLLAGDRIDVGEEDVGLRGAGGLQRGHEQARDGQPDHGDRPDPPRMTGHRDRDLLPDAVLRAIACAPPRPDRRVRDARPEQPAAGHQQGRAAGSSPRRTPTRCRWHPPGRANGWSSGPTAAGRAGR